jgi:hypothetical protein
MRGLFVRQIVIRRHVAVAKRIVDEVDARLGVEVGIPLGPVRKKAALRACAEPKPPKQKKKKTKRKEEKKEWKKKDHLTKERSRRSLFFHERKRAKTTTPRFAYHCEKCCQSSDCKLGRARPSSFSFHSRSAQEEGRVNNKHTRCAVARHTQHTKYMHASSVCFQ